MLKRKPMPLNINIHDYNNNNLHEYDPYIIDQNGELIIDTDWWNSLTEYIRDLITLRLCSYFKIDQVQVPHKEQRDDTFKQLTTVYQSYIDGFDYNVWYSRSIPDGPKDVEMVYVSFDVKEALINRDVSKLDEFRKRIKSYMKPNTQYFVRLSSTSGKNEKPIKPFDDPDLIIEHLMSLDIFIRQEYKRRKDTYLILIPWNNNIDSRCEFRIFVVNNRLTAASPQRYWEHNQLSQDELDAIEYALNNIRFINDVPYLSFVADVYIDIETRICHLIELNPFGAHCGAGSSLFNWETDFDVLHGIKDPELRYLSAINY